LPSLAVSKQNSNSSNEGIITQNNEWEILSKDEILGFDSHSDQRSVL
jgi:hypothetical protein